MIHIHKYAKQWIGIGIDLVGRGWKFKGGHLNIGKIKKITI